jgi:hypothetical protein
LQALLRRTRPLVQPADYRVLEGMVQTALYKEELLERRELAIHRLLRLAEASKLSTAKNSSAWQRAGRHADFVERP